jgi:hypothetical protein
MMTRSDLSAGIFKSADQSARVIRKLRPASGHLTRRSVRTMQMRRRVRPPDGTERRGLPEKRDCFVGLRFTKPCSQWQLSFMVFSEHRVASFELRYELRHRQTGFEHLYPKAPFFSQPPNDSPRHEGVAEDSEAGGRPSGLVRTASVA